MRQRLLRSRPVAAAWTERRACRHCRSVTGRGAWPNAASAALDFDRAFDPFRSSCSWFQDKAQVVCAGSRAKSLLGDVLLRPPHHRLPPSQVHCLPLGAALQSPGTGPQFGAESELRPNTTLEDFRIPAPTAAAQGLANRARRNSFKSSELAPGQARSPNLERRRHFATWP